MAILYDLPKSVRSSYKEECEAILSWMTDSGWLSQGDFDRLSFNFRLSKRASIYSFDENSILLPMSGDPLIAILQELQRSGLVEGRETNQGVEYRRRAA